MTDDSEKKILKFSIWITALGGDERLNKRTRVVLFVLLVRCFIWELFFNYCETSKPMSIHEHIMSNFIKHFIFTKHWQSNQALC